MIKFFGGILVVIACGLWGQYMSNEYIFRGKSLHKLKEIFTNIHGEIRYGRNDLPEAFMAVAKKTQEPYGQFLINTANDMEKEDKEALKTIWDRNINTYLSEQRFTNDDLRKIEELGNKLGYLDYEMQLGTIEMYLEGLNGDIAENSKDIREKCKVFRSLGVLVGLMIFIVLI